MKVSNKEQQGDAGLYAVGLKFTDELKWIFRPQPNRDLGIDAVVEVVRAGESKGELLALQVKSGASWFAESTTGGTVFRFGDEHYAYWREYPMPVLVVLHSPTNNAAYWQVVNKNTAASTGKRWKIEVPLSNVISKEGAEAIAKFCDYALPESSFSIKKLNDVSHGAAKRYSARLILNRELSKGEVVQLVRRVTNELRDREYYRNELTRNQWLGTPASVVWLFVYPSLEDETNNNWVCRSQWIDPKLEECFRPITLLGTEIGEDLVIDWSVHYKHFAKLHSESALSKEEYLSRVEGVLGGIEQYTNEAITLFKKHELHTILEADYLQKMSRLHSLIGDLYRKGTEIGPNPLECAEFGHA